MSKIDLILQDSEKAFLAGTSRMDRLSDKAEKYIATVGFVVSLLIIDLGNLHFGDGLKAALIGIVSCLAFAALGSSFVMSLFSRRVLPNLSYPRGEKIIDELRDDSIGDDESAIKIARMHLEAHDKNAQFNDNRARQLSVAGVLLVIGFTLAVAAHLISKILT